MFSNRLLARHHSCGLQFLQHNSSLLLLVKASQFVSVYLADPKLEARHMCDHASQYVIMMSGGFSKSKVQLEIQVS